MLIRKNTKAFKTILEIVSACQTRPDREKLIRLYITKAGQTVQNRISVEAIQGDAALFYEMNYQAVLNSLQSPNHQLQVSEEVPGIYYFHSTSNKTWDETPFEFDESIKTEFSSLPELPIVRKKEKAEKFVLPAPKVKSESSHGKKEKAKSEKEKAKMTVVKGPKQPDYQLKHEIEFTGLDKIIFRQANLNKKNVLDYYDQISEYLLPYLKDRPLENLKNAFDEDADEIPAWVQNTKGRKHPPMCNDKEHLLFFIERGYVQFDPTHARIKQPDSPDYILIAMDSPESELEKTIDGAHIVKEILDGLRLPSFVKTDGASGFHIYIPLDAKSNFDTSKRAAEYICKLVRLKAPDLISIEGVDEYAYGKVTLDYWLNKEGKGIIAPYSLASGESALVAAPLLWEDINEGFRFDDFNHETIFKRIKDVGDPFEALLKKKMNGDELLESLEERYGFLIN